MSAKIADANSAGGGCSVEEGAERFADHHVEVGPKPLRAHHSQLLFVGRGLRRNVRG